jgi:glycosyltransferase involved in cell wall biosynthesis
MRICYVSTGKTFGGGERLLASLVTAVAGKLESVSLVARRGTPLAAWGREQGLALLELPGHGRSPRSLWRLRRWLAQQQAELVVLNDPHAISSGALATLGLNLPRLGMRHTVFPIRSPWKHNKLDRVICVSAAAQRECLEAGVPQRRIAVIHGGVPRPRLSADNLRQVRELFGGSQDKNILAIGSLLPVKGFDTLIRAVAQGIATGRPWRLWIAGDGPQRDALLALAGDLGVADRLRILGFREDISELLAGADVFVSASHSEGLSLVLIEAMLARCPIVATAVGGSCEVLDADSQSRSPLAETFPPGDSEVLRSAIDRSLPPAAANQARLERARQWAQANFSVEQMAEKHLQLYRQVLAVAPPACRAAA